MQTTLATIDQTLTQAIFDQQEKSRLPDSVRAEAKAKARKIIGGFRIHDENAERQALDEMIEDRRKRVQAFIDDRKAVREKLAALGVTPLAVCPKNAWLALCRAAGLYVLAPDKEGKVYFSRSAWAGLPSDREGSRRPAVEALAKSDWKGFLERMFPSGASGAPNEDGWKATLVLPEPPADVAEVLIKAQPLKLQVAAVPEAIRFAETPTELLNQNPKDAWAQAQGYEDYADWLKRDPIVFTEHGTASAIIAQFGDFPIEQEVLDTVVKADLLIGERVTGVEPASYPGASLAQAALTENDLLRMYREQMAVSMQNVLMGSSGAPMYGGSGFFDFRRWTG